MITVAYLYYSVWILLTPLIDQDHYVQRFFPVKREHALMFTTLLGYSQMAFFFTFAGIILIRDGKHNQPQQ